jgi:glutathione S-transferase
MYVLRSSPASPFARKVRITAALLGLDDRIRIEDVDVNDPEGPLRRENPLGKLPALILENGEPLYDSRVICEFLDALAGGGRLIPLGFARFEVLRQQALADGLCDAALLQIYEVRYRPEVRRHPDWTDYQAGKVDRALDYAEAYHASPAGGIHLGHVALACALGYLDLRFEGAWRPRHPRLVAWLDDFADRVPTFEATRFNP